MPTSSGFILLYIHSFTFILVPITRIKSGSYITYQDQQGSKDPGFAFPSWVASIYYGAFQNSPKSSMVQLVLYETFHHSTEPSMVQFMMYEPQVTLWDSQKIAYENSETLCFPLDLKKVLQLQCDMNFIALNLKPLGAKKPNLQGLIIKPFFRVYPLFVCLLMARKSVSVDKSQTDKHKLKTVRQNMKKYTYIQYTSVIIFFSDDQK